MRLAICFAVALGACVSPAGAFECATSADCSGGTCEADNLCSFADANCPSGRSYGESSGKAGQCVEGIDVCGDGMVTGVEECDDSNAVATDFCIDCKLATCGDGQVQAGVEECDDTNADDADGCNNCLMCPAGAVTNPENGHCYWLVETAAAWNIAAADCTASKGYMVSIGDAAENAFVTGLLVNAQYWIGLEEIGFGGPRDFRWEDDKRLGAGFANWIPATEPSSGFDDECTGLLTATGTWDAQLCTNVLPYACERERPVVDLATRRIYHLFPGEQQRTYAEATTLCASLDPPGHLVTIADQAEQDFVDSLMDASRVWLGLDDIMTEGTFVWVTGEPTGFFNWNPNGFNGQEPDVPNAAGEDMAGMREDGTWDTRDQFDDENVICEIEPS